MLAGLSVQLTLGLPSKCVRALSALRCILSGSGLPHGQQRVFPGVLSGAPVTSPDGGRPAAAI